MYQLRRTCFLRQGDPVAADAVALDVAPQLLVLLRRPGSPLHARLVAARRAPHVRRARAHHTSRFQLSTALRWAASDSLVLTMYGGAQNAERKYETGTSSG